MEIIVSLFFIVLVSFGFTWLVNIFVKQNDKYEFFYLPRLTQLKRIFLLVAVFVVVLFPSLFLTSIAAESTEAIINDEYGTVVYNPLIENYRTQYIVSGQSYGLVSKEVVAESHKIHYIQGLIEVGVIDKLLYEQFTLHGFDNIGIRVYTFENDIEIFHVFALSNKVEFGDYNIKDLEFHRFNIDNIAAALGK